jgi:hypothetical protein
MTDFLVGIYLGGLVVFTWLNGYLNGRMRARFGMGDVLFILLWPIHPPALALQGLAHLARKARRP